MPTAAFFGEPLKQAVQKGEIPVSYVDQSVARILSQMEQFHMLDGSMPARAKMDDVASAHSVLALKTAQEGAVLLNQIGRFSTYILLAALMPLFRKLLEWKSKLQEI